MVGVRRVHDAAAGWTGGSKKYDLVEVGGDKAAGRKRATNTPSSGPECGCGVEESRCASTKRTGSAARPEAQGFPGFAANRSPTELHLGFSTRLSLLSRDKVTNLHAFYLCLLDLRLIGFGCVNRQAEVAGSVACDPQFR